MFKTFDITGPDGELYLRRKYLLDTRWGGIYFHQIVRSDPDRDLHDHPWKFLSILLWGFGYYEHQADGTMKYFPPFSINHRPDPAAPHRLELTKDPRTGREKPQWTLVFVGRKMREWGFHVPVGLDAPYGGSANPDSKYVRLATWVEFRKYLDVKFPKGWAKEPGYDEKPVQGAKT